MYRHLHLNERLCPGHYGRNHSACLDRLPAKRHGTAGSQGPARPAPLHRVVGKSRPWTSFAWCHWAVQRGGQGRGVGIRKSCSACSADFKSKKENACCLAVKDVKHAGLRKWYWQTRSLCPAWWVTYTCVYVDIAWTMDAKSSKTPGLRAWLHPISTADGLWFRYLQNGKTWPAAPWLNKRDVVMAWSWTSFSLGARHEKSWGVPGATSGKEPTFQCMRHKRGKRWGFSPWVGKIPWRRAWQPTPAFLPGESHGQRSLVGYRPWGRKESETTERLSSSSNIHTHIFIYTCLWIWI